MKMLFYINSLARGGAERVIIRLAESFKLRGHEVMIVTDYKDNNEYFTTINRKYIVRKPKNKSFSEIIVRNIKIITFLRSLCKKKDIDVIISFTSAPNIRAVLTGLLNKTKVVISVRTDYSREPFICRFLYKLADGCVFQTYETYNFFKKIKNSQIILNPIGEEFYTLNKTFNKLDNRKNIVSVSRLEQVKNIPGLIKAYHIIHKFYPNDKLIIYGSGSMLEELKRLSTELSMNEKIVFAGVSDNVLSDISSAKLFVLFSFYEGLSNSLMEAMALGLPCIATDVSSGGTRLLFGNNENGLIVPVNDEEALAESMRKILDTQELAKRLSSSAKIKAESFKNDKIIDEWETYLKKIIRN